MRRKRHSTNKLTIAQKNLLILIFSFLPFMLGLGYGVLTSGHRSYLSKAINLAGSQRMRTMLIASYSQQLASRIVENTGSSDEDSIRRVLAAEVELYQHIASSLKDGGAGLNENPFEEVVRQLERMSPVVNTYVATTLQLLENPANIEARNIITGLAMGLKDQYHSVTELYQEINDRMIHRQKMIDIAMLLFAAGVTISGLFLTRLIREQEDGIIKARDEAELANRAKSLFLANMSHEIRTPMNAIIGFSELTAAESTDRQQKRRLEIIKNAGSQLMRLINDILDLSKLEAHKMELFPVETDIASLCDDLISLFVLTAEKKGIYLRCELPAEPLPLFVLDEVHLRQILTNLISNALKFTEHGSVTLFVHYAADRQRLVFEVQDSGIGIPSNQLMKIFDSFHQVEGQNRGKYAGTGLGLSLCKEFTELMSGSLAVASEIGQGSCFTVSLPAVLSSRSAIENTDNFAWRKAQFHGETLLVVDDTESNRQYVAELMDLLNVRCTAVESSAQALKICEQETFDMILLDIRMPEMGGIDLYKNLQENGLQKDVPIFAFTASATEEEKEIIHGLGFAGYISKPVTPEQFVEVLSHSFVLDPVVRKEKNRELSLTDAQRAELPILQSFEIRLSNAVSPIDSDELLALAREIREVTTIEPFAEFAGQLYNAAIDFDISILSCAHTVFLSLLNEYQSEEHHG